jgi:hypothetical protein
MVWGGGNLHAHANVWETCLQLLERRGYELSIELGTDEEDSDLYCARRGSFTFTAWNPIELLGLAAIHEDVAPEEPRSYWWSEKTVKPATSEGHRDRLLLTRALAERDAREAALAAKRSDQPETFRAELTSFWNDYESVRDVAARLGVRPSVLEPWLRELGLVV